MLRAEPELLFRLKPVLAIPAYGAALLLPYRERALADFLDLVNLSHHILIRFTPQNAGRF